MAGSSSSSCPRPVQHAGNPQGGIQVRAVRQIWCCRGRFLEGLQIGLQQRAVQVGSPARLPCGKRHVDLHVAARHAAS